MNSAAWISIISLTGMMVLAWSALRAHNIGAKRSVVMALAWFAIFALAGAIFAAFY